MRLPSNSRSVDAEKTDTTAIDPPFPLLRPAVDFVAGLRLSVHRKLLAGFLTGALLLVAMAALSLVVIARMDERMEALETQARKVDLARQMLYDVTAQSHYRAMALLEITEDPVDAARWNQEVTDQKEEFAEHLGELDVLDPENDAFYQRLRDVDKKYAAASAAVVAAFRPDSTRPAERLHLSREHEVSHDLEDMLVSCNQGDETDRCSPLKEPFITMAEREMNKARDDFESDRTLLTAIVLAFSAVSVVVALLLGFLLSWAFILPVKKMQRALGRDHRGRLRRSGWSVPNRDEFGQLAHDLNSTSERLAQLVRAASARWRSGSTRDERLARARERGEVALPGEREPRAADADERDPRASPTRCSRASTGR